MPIWLFTLASMSPRGTQMFCSGMCAGAGLLGFTVLQTCVCDLEDVPEHLCASVTSAWSLHLLMLAGTSQTWGRQDE